MQTEFTLHEVLEMRQYYREASPAIQEVIYREALAAAARERSRADRREGRL